MLITYIYNISYGTDLVLCWSCVHGLDAPAHGEQEALEVAEVEAALPRTAHPQDGPGGRTLPGGERRGLELE